MTITALLVILGLQVTGPPPNRPVVLGGGPATFETVIVARDGMSRIDSPMQAVARTPAEWAALWRQHAGESTAPKVDLATRTIVAVFLGSRPSAGFAADIVGTREAGGVLTVEWRERRPDPRDITAQVLTSPMVIASIPMFAGEIRFQKLEK